MHFISCLEYCNGLLPDLLTPFPTTSFSNPQESVYVSQCPVRTTEAMWAFQIEHRRAIKLEGIRRLIKTKRLTRAVTAEAAAAPRKEQRHEAGECRSYEVTGKVLERETQTWRKGHCLEGVGTCKGA